MTLAAMFACPSNNNHKKGQRELAIRFRSVTALANTKE